MGTWGAKPFENDGAADWFADLWDECPVPQKVEETLNLDVEENAQEIRAAVHVLVQLGENFVWSDALDKHCDLAIQRLEEIKAMEDYSGKDFQEAFDSEIEILRSRISKNYKKK